MKAKEAAVSISIRLMKEGWITPLDSVRQGGVLALSQRVSELRRDGVSVIDKWVETRRGKRMKAYRIVRA